MPSPPTNAETANQPSENKPLIEATIVEETTTIQLPSNPMIFVQAAQFMLLFVAALYLTRPIVLPIVLAILLKLLLQSGVRRLEQQHVPRERRILRCNLRPSTSSPGPDPVKTLTGRRLPGRGSMGVRSSIREGRIFPPSSSSGLDPRIGQSTHSAQIELLAAARDARLKARHDEFGDRGRAPTLT
jgi:hypothetical protein